MQRRSRILWALAALLVGVLLLKFFVADVYSVNSGSMRPTIFGGSAKVGGEEFREWVLVSYDRNPALERYDLVVVRSRQNDDPIVKRVIGLPGETVRISGGDVLIDGARLPADGPRPAPIAVFDDRFLDVAECFEFSSAPDGPWSRVGDAFLLDALDINERSNEGMMLFHKGLQDDYLDENHERVAGTRQANDAALVCEVRLSEHADGARLRFQLVEEGDTFEATLVLGATEAEVVITRHNAATLSAIDPTRKIETMFAGPIAIDGDRWYRVSFANIDNSVTLRIDGGAVASIAYDANVPHPARTGDGQRSLGSRVSFGASGCRVSFRRIRVLRDLFYTPAGEYAISAPLSLGPDEYFLLGDNSASSLDSRFSGPISAAEIIGRPLCVVGPFGRQRMLAGAVGAGVLAE